MRPRRTRDGRKGAEEKEAAREGDKEKGSDMTEPVRGARKKREGEKERERGRGRGRGKEGGRERERERESCMLHQVIGGRT
jgi:hypothetical protein